MIAEPGQGPIAHQVERSRGRVGGRARIAQRAQRPRAHEVGLDGAHDCAAAAQLVAHRLGFVQRLLPAAGLAQDHGAARRTFDGPASQLALPNSCVGSLQRGQRRLGLTETGQRHRMPAVGGRGLDATRRPTRTPPRRPRQLGRFGGSVQTNQTVDADLAQVRRGVGASSSSSARRPGSTAARALL